MSVIEMVAVTPGGIIGCIVGIAIAAGVHWLFPNEALAYAYAIIIAVTTVTGHVLAEHWANRPPGGNVSKRQK
jgi:hypothetical protein